MPPFETSPGLHGVSAALEFAVQFLGVEEIVVMGHGRCGGISAALDPDAGPLSPGDFIGKWMLYFRHFGSVNWANLAVGMGSSQPNQSPRP